MFSPYFGHIFDNFVKLNEASEDVWDLEPYTKDPLIFQVKLLQISNNKFKFPIFLGLFAHHFVARQDPCTAKS